MGAWADPLTFGANLWLIIGGLVLAVFVLLALLGLWVLAKILVWRGRRWHAERQARGRKYGPDGKPLPPSAAGLCDRCERAFEMVYYMPSGGRLCPSCYEALHRSAAGGT
ncbi:MAG: hypothetical protein AMJ81_06885 [Phycisphaerae bacterium SM23_33]|nr:MAG: hypothetical protein AMJ81_06885 [Phycisphaerae bacterium SM23_33]